ncbi:MAG: dTDP-4-dehydrorhamnose reductase [Acidimicrobiales bacterium]|nr:dTDP-4-dehydrorhamnose reductase [Acidimicrobiales bacterium]
MPTALVTGAAGQLAQDVLRSCAARGIEARGVTRAELDITDRAAVLDAVRSTNADVVVNCAAHTKVDLCEAEPDAAFAINAMGVRHLAEAVGAVGAHLIQVSTDYVFSGDLDRPYHEWDRPDPRSVYGCSKLAGELEVPAGHTIVRTSWVCGEHGSNMVKTILRLAAEHERLTFVADQIGHPTFTADLADALVALVVDRRPGTFHLTNAGAVSWFEFAREVLRLRGLDPERVGPITTAELQPPRPAPRPANSVLDNRAWRLSGLAPLRDFREPLAELLGRI